VFDSDRELVIKRALAQNVTRIITIGIDCKSSQRAVILTRRHPSLFATVGIHPHNADRCDKNDLALITSMAAHHKVVAIGEIGLDFYRNLSSRKKQVERFKQQLDIAMALHLPVVIHARQAYEEVLKILLTFSQNGSRGVIHCFSADYHMAKEFISMGYHISISGTVTFKNALQVQEVAARIPFEKILLETDAPFLAPLPHRGRRNEPRLVTLAAQKLAELRGVSIQEVAEQTTSNTCGLFNLTLDEQ
jgi:TatD DNase family protein